MVNVPNKIKTHIILFFFLFLNSHFWQVKKKKDEQKNKNKKHVRVDSAIIHTACLHAYSIELRVCICQPPKSSQKYCICKFFFHLSLLNAHLTTQCLYWTHSILIVVLGKSATEKVSFNSLSLQFSEKKTQKQYTLLLKPAKDCPLAF